jgi:hypothetical protein
VPFSDLQPALQQDCTWDKDKVISDYATKNRGVGFKYVTQDDIIRLSSPIVPVKASALTSTQKMANKKRKETMKASKAIASEDAPEAAAGGSKPASKKAKQ